jgi:hypothetical protein
MAFKIQNSLTFLFLSLIFIGSAVSAQSKKFAVYKAKIVNNGAAVYKNADFDAPVLTYVNAGREFEISSKIFNGAFYRIKVSNKVIGYIADTDIKPLNLPKRKKETKNQPEEVAKAQEKSETKDRNSKRPYTLTRFIGLQYSYLNYREETMTLKPTAGLGFYGLKMSGPDIVVEGEMTTELNFLYHPGAPKYYELGTRKPAGGWIFIGNFLFSTVFPQSKDTMSFFGFGPQFKYSKFNVEMAVNGRDKNYSMDDMAFGAAFNLGVGVKLGSVSLRGEIQYFWEQMHYYGLATSLQLPF